METRKKKKRNSWLSKLFVGAIFWVASKILEPVPFLSGLVDVVAFAI